MLILQSMKNKWTYWLCQCLGWFGMVAIETINYTFFIVGKFNLALFWTFVSYAVLGILCTHLYRYLLKRSDFFQKRAVRIWLTAFISAIIISAIISMVSFLPAITQNANFFFKNVTLIDIVATIINWMRYVGVWIIIYFMYKILEQKNALLQEKLTIENLAKTTELELLKTQLNPHFLFNALNSIKALVIINPEQSRDAIVKLSELLRFTLQYGKELLIPVNDEMKEVKKYLELEQLRFGNRLQIEYSIDDTTLSQTIPPAIVLTLAENAIKHGVAKQMGNSILIISSIIYEDSLHICIENTGSYLPENSTGIGLKHITRRLEEVYHHKAFFTITQQDATVIACIKTPLSWQ
jgi:sensor histidine kinase YesM